MKNDKVNERFDDMEVEALLQSITDDEILRTVTKDMIYARNDAQEKQQQFELREAKLLDRLDKASIGQLSVNISDPDEIERIVEKSESRDMVARKIVAIRKAGQISWIYDRDYRKTMATYFTYITPILTDMETAKNRLRREISALREAQAREMAMLTKRFTKIENAIENLMSRGGESGPYEYQKQFVHQFGGTARADVHAAAMAKAYRKPIDLNQPDKIPMNA